MDRVYTKFSQPTDLLAGLHGPDRRAKVYSVTEAGQRQLQNETENWERIAAVIGKVLQPADGERPSVLRVRVALRESD